MQILNLIKSHKPVFSISFCVFTFCCRIIYKLPCFSHWFEAHTQDNPTLPLLCQRKDSSLQGCLLGQPHAFICFSAPTPPSAQPELQPPLPEDVFHYWRCVTWTPAPIQSQCQKSRKHSREWMWLQSSSSPVAGGTGYLWQHSAPARAFPWENQETNAMTTGISLMSSRSAQGGFLTFFLFLRWHYSFVTERILKIDTRF